MSEELNQNSDLDPEVDAVGDAEDEYEEISSDEVDRIVEALETLIDSTQSVNIQTYLEEALNNIFYLVYDEDVEESPEDDSADAA